MDLKTVVRILSALLTCIIVEMLLPRWEKQREDHAETEEALCAASRTVCLRRKTALWMRIVMGLLCLISLALLVFPRISLLPYIPTMIGLCVLLLLCMGVLSCTFHEIEYFEEEFVYTNAFGLTRRFAYTDVLKIVTGKHVKIVTKTKKLCIPACFVGTTAFLHYVEERNVSKREEKESIAGNV